MVNINELDTLKEVLKEYRKYWVKDDKHYIKEFLEWLNAKIKEVKK